MLADEFTSFVRRRPFRPYRIVMSDGQAYDIFHTDFALVLFDSVIVFSQKKDREQLDFERSTLVSLTHVVRIELIDADDRAAIKRKRRKK